MFAPSSGWWQRRSARCNPAPVQRSAAARSQRGHSRAGPLGLTVLVLALVGVAQVMSSPSCNTAEAPLAPALSATSVSAAARSAKLASGPQEKSGRLNPGEVRRLINAAKQAEQRSAAELRRTAEPLAAQDFYSDWLLSRAFGPKRTKRAESPPAPANASLPAAIAQAPDWAQWVATVESGAPPASQPEWKFGDSETFEINAWRLDGLAMLAAGRADSKVESQQRQRRDLAAAFASALWRFTRTLNREDHLGPDPLGAYRLAQALYRAAPFVADQRAYAEVRRLYGKLRLRADNVSAAPAQGDSPKPVESAVVPKAMTAQESILQDAARTEATASFVHFSLEVDAPQTVATSDLGRDLMTDLAALVERLERRGTQAQAAGDPPEAACSECAPLAYSVRALRSARRGLQRLLAADSRPASAPNSADTPPQRNSAN